MPLLQVTVRKVSSIYVSAGAAIPWIALELLLGLAIGSSREKEGDKR